MFLQTAGMNAGDMGVFAGLVTLGIGFMVVWFVVLLALYVYMSFAYMMIARKNNQSNPGLAWIPFVGPYLIAYKASKMHWWPWLLLIGFIIPFVSAIAGLAFGVFAVIWNWKMFEAIGRPGWWAIFMIIPLLNIVYFVFIGIAAWGNSSGKQQNQTSKEKQ